jgi:hypothetical protein
MPFPSLTATPTDSASHEITLKEPVDMAILDKLISSSLLKTSFHNPWAAAHFSSERKQLREYRKLVKGGFAHVTYKMVKGMSYGRSNPERALGLFSLRREIRQTLAKGKLIDIDIKNAHPTMLYQIMKHYGRKCANLKAYVENRDTYLADVMKEYGVTRDEAKNLFIALLFFGSFEEWASKLSITKPATLAIDNFKMEIQTLGKIIKENNPAIIAEVEKRKKEQGYDKYNETGSVVSWYLQEIERQILDVLFNYCKGKGLIPDDIAVRAADGLMLLESIYDESLLTTFNEIIKAEFELDLEFMTKPFTQDYLEILDSNQLTEAEIVTQDMGGYDNTLTVNTEEDFSVKKLGELFFADTEALDVEQYTDNFHNTKSFKYFDAYHGYFYLSNTVNKIYKNEITPYAEFSKSFEHLYVKLKKGVLKFTNLYSNSSHKRIYSTFQFAPNKKTTDDKFNLFRGFKYNTVDNTTYDPEVVQPFINHIHYITREDALPSAAPHPVSDYLLNWFSHIVQKPDVKTKVAIVIFSMTEGVGKNIISDIFGELLHGYCGKFRDTSALTDKFNGEMMGKLFVVGDEINARAQEVANELKDIITRIFENIEFKGRDKMLMEDFKNYFFTTNNENIFKVTNSDRRLELIEAPEEKKDAAYYTALFAFKDNAVAMKHLFNFFASRDISAFSPSHIVETDYKKRLVAANLPAYVRYVRDNFETISGCELRTKDMYARVVDYAKHNRLVSNFTEHMFSTQMKKVFSEFQSLNAARQSVYVFDDEEAVSAAIDKYVSGL